MKKLLRFIVASLIIIGGMAVVSFAQESHHPKGINERQQNQHEAIKDGVQDGDISRRELAGLVREQNQIRRQERVFRSDGDFTRIERARVQHQLNQSARHIRRAKRN